MLRDRGLQFFHVNEEFPVSASHQLALITSLPFVHTARRYYRLNDRSEVFGLDARDPAPSGAVLSRDREDDRTRPFRGSKSRNKVSVGEPAEGSLETGPRRRPYSRCPRAPYPTPWPRALGERGDRVRVNRAPGRPSDRPPARRDPRPRVDRKMVTVEDLCVHGASSARLAHVAASRPRNSRHFEKNFFLHLTPNGGSLGSWIDEDRSYLRVVV